MRKATFVMAGLPCILIASIMGATTASAQPLAPSTAITESSYSPNTGSDVGGNLVTVTGSGFSAVTAVFVGKTYASDVTINSDTSMTLRMPAHPQGSTMIRACAPGLPCGGIPLGYTYTANEVTTVAAQGPIPDDSNPGEIQRTPLNFSCPAAAPYLRAYNAEGPLFGIQSNLQAGVLLDMPQIASRFTTANGLVSGYKGDAVLGMPGQNYQLTAYCTDDPHDGYKP